MWCINAERSSLAKRNLNSWQWRISIGSRNPIYTAQSNVRERFSHAVGAINGIRKSAQLSLKLWRNNTSANNQAECASQQGTFMRHLERFVNLHRRERSKVGSLVQMSVRVSSWSYGHKLQRPSKRAHHHHLSCNIFKWHTKQRRVTLLQAKSLNGGACTVPHFNLFHLHLLRLSRTARGVNRHSGWGLLPRIFKRLNVVQKVTLLFWTIPQHVALQVQGSLIKVLHKQLSCAQTLRHNTLRVNGSTPLCNGIKSHIAFKSRGCPISNVAVACQSHPFASTRKCTMQRRFQHNELWTNRIE